jgi:YfiH family protein
MLSGAFRGEAIAFVSQVHGATVVEAETIDSRTEADAIMLRRGAAGVRVADCVPIAIVDPVQHAAVIIHAGWRGHAAGVIEAAAAQLGGQASDWLAVVGPSISGAAYQVGHDVIDADSRFFSFATPDSEGKFLLDLRALTRSTLADLGVDDERQWISSQVTDGGKTFFSDRAQRPCGRFAMIVSWQS